MKFWRVVLTCAALCAVSLPAQAAEIVINGSTTVLPIMQKVGEAFMAANPDAKLVISGGGSGNGIKALNEGLCAVAMSSRDMKDSEKALAKSKNIVPVRTAVAVDALVPVVHPQNPVRNLTDAQLRDIFAGNIKNWQEVGGEDARIVLVSRDTSSGTYETWEEKIMRKTRVAPNALMQASSGAVVQTVSGNKNALGYVGFGYVSDAIRPLQVNSVTASAQTALDGTWPIARELYLFTNGEPTGTVADLFTFLLDPQKGQKLVLATGFIPLRK